MGASDLEKLLTRIKQELRDNGRIVKCGQDYALTFICLDLTAISGEYSTDELYHAKRDQNDLPGKHSKESLETAADAACQLLKETYDWEATARPNGVGKVDVTVIRNAPRATRNVWGSGGEEKATPDDPMIMF